MSGGPGTPVSSTLPGDSCGQPGREQEPGVLSVSVPTAAGGSPRGQPGDPEQTSSQGQDNTLISEHTLSTLSSRLISLASGSHWVQRLLDQRVTGNPMVPRVSNVPSG